MPVGLRMKHSGDGRLNLTFRDVVGVLDETQFPKFRVSYADADCIINFSVTYYLFILLQIMIVQQRNQCKYVKYV